MCIRDSRSGEGAFDADEVRAESFHRFIRKPGAQIIKRFLPGKNFIPCDGTPALISPVSYTHLFGREVEVIVTFARLQVIQPLTAVSYTHLLHPERQVAAAHEGAGLGNRALTKFISPQVGSPVAFY